MVCLNIYQQSRFDDASPTKNSIQSLSVAEPEAEDSSSERSFSSWEDEFAGQEGSLSQPVSSVPEEDEEDEEEMHAVVAELSEEQAEDVMEEDTPGTHFTSLTAPKVPILTQTLTK